jgi:hypothetical protein
MLLFRAEERRLYAKRGAYDASVDCLATMMKGDAQRRMESTLFKRRQVAR